MEDVLFLFKYVNNNQVGIYLLFPFDTIQNIQVKFLKKYQVDFILSTPLIDLFLTLTDFVVA